LSTIRESILEAIDGGAGTHAAVMEATGFESVQITNALQQLRASGAITKGADGWSRMNGVEKQKSRVHQASNGADSASPPPAAKKRAYKKRAKSKVAAAPAIAAARPAKAKSNGVNGAVNFAAFGEVVVVRRKDLAELLAMVERWRGVMGAA
jgi:hypothetical protein